MGLYVDTGTLELAKPEIAEGSFLITHDEVTTVFDSRTSAGDDGGAVAEAVHATEIASHGNGRVVEKGCAVGLLGGFEFVDEVSEDFRIGAVAHFGSFPAFSGGVVAHAVGADLRAEACNDAVTTLLNFCISNEYTNFSRDSQNSFVGSNNVLFISDSRKLYTG